MGNGYSYGCNGNNGHQLDEDVQTRTGGIFEGVTDGIAYDSRFVGLGMLATENPGLNVLFCIIPRPTGI
jgi:hypothetical protein